jgi:hypothetical protein
MIIVPNKEQVEHKLTAAQNNHLGTVKNTQNIHKNKERTVKY